MGVMTAAEDVTAKQISELEARRYQAMTDGDVGALGELFAADMVYTHSNAVADSRQTYLDKIASGELDYGPMEHPESRIMVRGDCALVFGDMRGEVRVAGEVRVLNSLALSVWTRENDSWRLLAFQPTRYPA
jgi:ketosteroid isomerase-like protein